MTIAAKQVGSTQSFPTSALVTQAVGGDRTAKEELCREAWPSAYRVAYLTTGDPSIAEDISQEVLVAMLASLANFDPDRPLQPWVERIAANKSIDWLRRRKVRPEVLTAEEADLEDPRLASQAAELIDEAESGRAIAALGGLPAEQRTAVAMRHLLGYAPQEIAEMVGVPAATVRTWIHRGLLRLRDELSEGETYG